MTHTFTEPSAATTGVLRSAQRLQSRKGRETAGRFLAEGRQAVREALRVRGLVERLFVTDPSILAEAGVCGYAGRAAPAADRVSVSGSPTPTIETFTLTAEQLKRLTDTVTPQGIVAVCRQTDATLDAIADPRLVVICAQIRDPGNAGTIIRCADAFGADVVIMTSDSVELHNPKTIRASVGSVFHLPIVTGIPLDEAAAWCRDRGVQILAADGGGESLSDLQSSSDLARPTAWLMGNEAWGLPSDSAAHADRIVGIPMWGQAESLNLSTAAAICLYTTASARHATLREKH